MAYMYMYVYVLQSRRLTIIFQTRVHDVSQTADEKLQHDAKMAAPGDIKLRVSNVPQHHSRLVYKTYYYIRMIRASVRLYIYIIIIIIINASVYTYVSHRMMVTRHRAQGWFILKTLLLCSRIQLYVCTRY